MRRDRKPIGQFAAMQRHQEIDGDLVARFDRRRRIAFDDPLVAEILHDDQPMVEIGLQDRRRREIAVTQTLRQRDIRNDILGEMSDGAVGLAVAHRRTVGTARRVHQHHCLFLDHQALVDACRGVAFHAPSRHVAEP